MGVLLSWTVILAFMLAQSDQSNFYHRVWEAVRGFGVVALLLGLILGVASFAGKRLRLGRPGKGAVILLVVTECFLWIIALIVQTAIMVLAAAG